MVYSCSIGIDFGGTNIKAVAVSATGAVLGRESRVTRDGQEKVDDWVTALAKLIIDFEAALGNVTPFVGIAIPGIIAADSRSVASCPGKLAGIEGVVWGTRLGRGRLVPLLNDAHAALIGEHWIGAARGFRDAILLTLGTGVGGAILSQGRLLRGAHGRAGILGHMSMDPFGAAGPFGTPSPLEHWIGDHTVAERTNGRFHSTKELVAAASSGDAIAQAAWRKSIRALAVAVASCGMILDLEAVVVGGGIAQAGPDLFEPLGRELDQFEWRCKDERIKIIPASLGAWSGAIGAAKNALDSQG